VDELIRARPVLGYGFDAARMVGEPNAVAVGVSREVNFLHPHNGFLQVWLELGVIGVALFLSGCALASLSLYRRAADRAALATTLATVLTVSVFWEVSFGIWQGWWLAAIGLTFVALRAAVRPSPP
jgi:O-antigen ligase